MLILKDYREVLLGQLKGIQHKLSADIAQINNDFDHMYAGLNAQFDCMNEDCLRILTEFKHRRPASASKKLPILGGVDDY